MSKFDVDSLGRYIAEKAKRVGLSGGDDLTGSTVRDADLYAESARRSVEAVEA